MSRRLGALASLAGVIVLLTSACAGAPSAPAASGTASAPPATPTPYALVLAADAMTLIDGDGTALADAPLTDGMGIVALVAGATGVAPADEREPAQAATRYDWGPLTVVVADDGTTTTTMTGTEVGGLQLRAPRGIAVGSSIGAALAQGAAADDADPAVLRYEPSGGASLRLVVADGRVARIVAPATDD